MEGIPFFFLKSSSEFYLTDLGEAFLQEKFLFQKNFGFNSVPEPSTDQTDVPLFQSISFWKFSFDREAKTWLSLSKIKVCCVGYFLVVPTL